MKSPVAIVSLLLGLSRAVSAAEPASIQNETVAVVAVVQRFFDALHHKNGDELRAVCQPGAQFTSGRARPEGYALRQRPIETDIADLAALKETWLERMWTPTVQINGRIAVIWTRYDFHRGGKFAHNGTDCFTLLRTDQGWKIVCGAYSVEQTSRPFSLTVKPDAFETADFWVPAVADSTILGANGPVTMRVIAHFDSPVGQFDEIVIQQVSGASAPNGAQ